LNLFGHFNDDKHEEIVIRVENYSGARRYSVEDTLRPVIMAIKYTRSNIQYVARGSNGQGTINITSDNNEFVEGTFNFVGVTGANEIHITQGSFKALYDFKAVN